MGTKGDWYRMLDGNKYRRNHDDIFGHREEDFNKQPKVNEGQQNAIDEFPRYGNPPIHPD